MRYSICVNAAGCLPDSDSYPYVVDDAEQSILEAIISELDVCRGDVAEFATAEQDAMINSACETFKRENGYLAVPLEGTYMLTVEPIQPSVNRSIIAATLSELGWHELADDVRRGVPIKSIEAKIAKRGEPGSSAGSAGEGEALAAAIEAGTL